MCGTCCAAARCAEKDCAQHFYETGHRHRANRRQDNRCQGHCRPRLSERRVQSVEKTEIKQPFAREPVQWRQCGNCDRSYKEKNSRAWHSLGKASEEVHL